MANMLLMSSVSCQSLVFTVKIFVTFYLFGGDKIMGTHDDTRDSRDTRGVFLNLTALVNRCN